MKEIEKEREGWERVGREGGENKEKGEVGNGLGGEGRGRREGKGERMSE